MLRFLCCVFAVSLFVCQQTEANDTIDPDVQGIWFCKKVNGMANYQANRCVLIQRENEFVLITGTGVTQSTAETGQGKMNISRYDGKTQQGIYQVDGSDLWLTLGDPEKERPRHFGHKRGELKVSSKTHSHYLFSRLPTPDGLAVLRHALDDE
jgi:hypothetical protein